MLSLKESRMVMLELAPENYSNKENDGKEINCQNLMSLKRKETFRNVCIWKDLQS